MAQINRVAANSVKIRSWPSMLFMWPSMLMSLVAGLATYTLAETSSTHELWGSLYLIVFALNLIVVTFDSPRSTSLTLLFAAVALAWLFVELNRRYNIIQPLRTFIEDLTLRATPDFYFFLFGVYLILFIGMLISTRFDYWVINSNELVHYQSLMQDVARHPTEGMQYNKEIPDFFEYLLAGAGRIVLNTPTMKRPITLNNVPGINRVARQLDVILETRRVVVTNESAVTGDSENLVEI